MNSDATDFVLPDPGRQAECIRLALRRAGMSAEDIDIVSTHATGTTSGDAQECQALRQVWGHNGHHTLFNNTKSFIGHAMGAAGRSSWPATCPPSTTESATRRSTSIGPIPNATCRAWWPTSRASPARSTPS